MRPVRPDGHGPGWAELGARREQITKWADGGVPVVKIGNPAGPAGRGGGGAALRPPDVCHDVEQALIETRSQRENLA